MIAVTVTHKNGVQLLNEMTIAIDAEKIVKVRTVDTYYAEILYGETFDRKREPVLYQLTTSAAAVLATIAGDYSTLLANPYLTVTAYKDLVSGATETLNLQERYIVDIREARVKINNTVTACRRIEYVPGSFDPVIIYVSTNFAAMVDSTPAEVTTTEEPTTTAAATTTVEPTTTAGD